MKRWKILFARLNEATTDGQYKDGKEDEEEEEEWGKKEGGRMRD